MYMIQQDFPTALTVSETQKKYQGWKMKICSPKKPTKFFKSAFITKVVYFYSLLKCFRSLFNSIDPETYPVGAVWSGSKLLASILTLTNIIIKYVQQTT